MPLKSYENVGMHVDAKRRGNYTKKHSQALKFAACGGLLVIFFKFFNFIIKKKNSLYLRGFLQNPLFDHFVHPPIQGLSVLGLGWRGCYEVVSSARLVGVQRKNVVIL